MTDQAPISVPHHLDLADIQAGPLVQLAKRNETFLFFAIAEDVPKFRRNLHKILTCITTTADALRGRRKVYEYRAQRKRAKLAGTNIAFSAKGLEQLGFQPGELKDDAFNAGQLNRAEALGDKLDTWLPEFKREIHGLITVAGDSLESVNSRVDEIIEALGDGITIVHRVDGKSRPEELGLKGKEHFGFEDGISQPLVRISGGAEPLPGQIVVDPGVLLIGQHGDPFSPRPEWAKNGSIAVYRHLKQLVPEFNKFSKEAALTLPLGSDIDKAAAFIRARMVGRWPSGCPLPLSPLEDNESIGTDKQQNNLFDFKEPDPDSQKFCPFAAHVRKTGPRSDIEEQSRKEHSIMRAGIPFGDEVSEEEERTQTTIKDRGLSFLSYQSTLGSTAPAEFNKSFGFEFMQRFWCNFVKFPLQKPQEPGFDPLVGQNPNPQSVAREMTGIDPNNADGTLPIPFEFVVSQGGEYFLAPSMTTIRNIANAYA